MLSDAACCCADCAFFVRDERSSVYGCLLERLMPRDEWDDALAERWLTLRESLTALAR